MINGSLEQFLDTGWFSEAELYLNGYVYWCEAEYDPACRTHTFHVDRWAAQCKDNQCYHSILEPDGSLKWTRILEITDTNIDRIKQRFLQEPIFDGKTFWQVEQELVWVEDGGALA